MNAPAPRPLARNLQAGTTTAVVLIPQAMAYAMVAGVPPVHGLYASVLPLVGYALVGRSRELAVGPGALDTLLVGSALGSLAFVTEANWVAWAALTAGLVGLIQLALAGLRAGFLVNFLSRPVISGFTSAAAIVIALSQVRNLLGLPVPVEHRFVELVPTLVGGLGGMHAWTAAVGLTSYAALVALRRWRRRFPGPLAVVATASLVSWIAGLEERGVAVVGALPRGLPSVTWPDVGWDEVRALLPTALAVAMVGYLTMISIAQTFANRRGVTLDANRELAGAGVANVLAGLSQAFPVSASFSRSAVHADGEPDSPRALLVTAGWVVLTLALLGPLLATLPRATLAAIIIVAVLGLIDVAIVRHLWRVKRADMALLLLTFVATLGLGVEPGIGVGVLASLGLLLFRTTRPHAAVLGRLGDSTDFRNVKNYAHARTTPGVLIVRMDAQFYFGNVTFLRALLRRLEDESSEPLRAVILDAASMNQLDSSANDALESIVHDYQQRGIRFAIAHAKMPVVRVLRASGLEERIGRDHFFLNLDAAERALAADPPTPSQPKSGDAH